ncbi:hypothetical protein VOLCADRAFT_91683 [Volvox carteri f. nagariensis]|uniref:Uncharacterized protein n=1 Tax=Volvox carteri f. nagariensis TaxID=3068 RepID=D8TXQ5_VOLCA|nr:uncharacterized protein VOLCADRAFT_91683 [Volvox carteri f. nagariensis]EFJ47680.1 hypothetical protein VOLCADRAFT_91683 [Volvox carteri f. nagariensis]|eukprot:XP_002951151.1 hypothetical protein VOLCADRAFT_91683 [Volvox carteri f. nagariensis]
MAPSENATNDPQRPSLASLQKDEARPILLQAAKVAIHVRPISPVRSPVKYLPVDTSWGSQLDVSAPRDVNARHVLHMEVEQQRRSDPNRPGPGSKRAPRAIVDVVQVPSRGPIPPAPNPNAAAAAAISITVQPRAAPAPAAVTQMGNRPTPTIALPEAGKQSSTRQPLLSGHRHPAAAAAAAMGPASGSTQAPSRGPGRGFQPNITPAPSAYVRSNPLPHTAAPATTVIAVAAGSTEAAAAVVAPAVGAVAGPAAGLSPAHHRSGTGSRIAKGGGAALLAEILRTQLAAAAAPPLPPPLPAPANVLDGFKPGGHFFPGGPQISALGSRQSKAPPRALSGGPGDSRGEPSAAAAAAAAAAEVAWSWDDGPTLAAAAAAGIRDPGEEARRARRRHRKRVARIVVDHWKQFARQRLQAVAARRHLRRRLLTAAWVAWQAETASARARMRLAAVYDMKRSYLGLGRCVQAWSTAAKRLAQLRDLQERVTVDSAPPSRALQHRNMQQKT